MNRNRSKKWNNPKTATQQNRNRNKTKKEEEFSGGPAALHAAVLGLFFLLSSSTSIGPERNYLSQGALPFGDLLIKGGIVEVFIFLS